MTHPLPIVRPGESVAWNARMEALARSERVQHILEAMYLRRPCFSCRRLGWCEHREPLVELAYLER